MVADYNLIFDLQGFFKEGSYNKLLKFFSYSRVQLIATVLQDNFHMIFVKIKVIFICKVNFFSYLI